MSEKILDDPTLGDRLTEHVTNAIVNLRATMPRIEQDLLVDGSITAAAVCYADTAGLQVAEEIKQLNPRYVHKDWPWPRECFRPDNDPRVNLATAIALLMAELERLDRRAQKGGA